MKTAVKTRDSRCCGEKSPYPTVEIVVMILRRLQMYLQNIYLQNHAPW